MKHKRKEAAAKGERAEESREKESQRDTKTFKE